MKNLRKLKGQELVEFALILPIMLVILVAIAEMGFMWTLRGTVADAVKSSVQQMQTIAGTDLATAEATLEANIRNYLVTHGVPNASSLDVTLSDPNASDYTTVSVSYSYNPTFTLPNFFGIQLLPSTVAMGSSQVINSAVLRNNDYTAGDTTLPSIVNPASPSSILVDDPTADDSLRKKMAFIVDLPGPVDKIVNWWGHDIMPANAGINSVDGTIWVKSPYNNFGDTDPNVIGWGSSGETYSSLLLANGYTTGIYVNGTAGVNIRGVQLPGSLNIHDGDMGSSLNWCTPTSAGGGDCDGDLSASGTLLSESIYNIGTGYEVLPPTPSSSPIDQVTLPSGDLASDKTFRDTTYQDKTYSSLKFYYPKDVDTTKFTPPAEGGDLTSGAVQAKLLSQTMDGDGDGIPNAWDDSPSDPDDNKDRILDGHQSGTVATFIADATAKNDYEVFGWSTDGKTGDIPKTNITTSGPTLAPSDYVSPDAGTTPYASSACATCSTVASCTASCNTNPYFLKVVSEYTTSSGQQMRIPRTAASSTYYSTEKYKEPDPNKRIYSVQVFSRDFDMDGVYEPATGTATPVDDDGNNDGMNNGSTSDTLPLSDGTAFTRGLIFVEGTVAGATFTSASDPTLGYSVSVPSDGSISEYTTTTKATTTPAP
jgi:hypothetical protein